MCKALQSVIVPSKENQISKEVASYVLPPLRWLTYWRMHCNYHFLFLLPCMPLSFRPLDSRPKQEQGEWGIFSNFVLNKSPIFLEAVAFQQEVGLRCRLQD